MSQFEVLNKMLFNMNNEIVTLNQYISEKGEGIQHMKDRVKELETILLKEQEHIEDAIKKRDKLVELRDEATNNFKQIEEGVGTLIDILTSKISS
jgi:hypothetical protein